MTSNILTSTIPKTTILPATTQIKKIAKDTTCVICLSELGNKVVWTSCNHPMDFDCYETWIKTAKEGHEYLSPAAQEKDCSICRKNTLKNVYVLQRIGDSDRFKFVQILTRSTRPIEQQPPMQAPPPIQMQPQEADRQEQAQERIRRRALTQIQAEEPTLRESMTVGAIGLGLATAVIFGLRLLMGSNSRS